MLEDLYLEYRMLAQTIKNVHFPKKLEEIFKYRLCKRYNYVKQNNHLERNSAPLITEKTLKKTSCNDVTTF